MNEQTYDQTDMFRLVLDALPALVLIVDDDVRIHDCNTAVMKLSATQKPAILKQRGGDVLHCIHATDVAEGCGRGPHCRNCVIRNSVTQAFRGQQVTRQRTKLEILQDQQNNIEIYALITTTPFRYQANPLALLVIEDINEIAELRKRIPICAVCKKVRDEQAFWQSVEVYFKEHWDVDFSHGLCPECLRNERSKLHQEVTSHYLKMPSDKN